MSLQRRDYCKLVRKVVVNVRVVSEMETVSEFELRTCFADYAGRTVTHCHALRHTSRNSGQDSGTDTQRPTFVFRDAEVQ
jgi:FtsP/CotA-like multicopper oxidase with cupredoxin domain